MPKIYIAVDIGGSSIKITAAQLRDGRIQNLREQTLPNPPLLLGRHQYIDIYRLYSIILEALRELCEQGLAPILLGIDTYGNGYGAFNADGEMVGLPFFYKDARTSGILEPFAQRLPLRALYEKTGVYPTDIRVLMQMFHDVRTGSDRLSQAQNLLLFPDILAYFLTGQMTSERSMASVAHLLDIQGEWCTPVMEALGIQRHLFAPLVNGGEHGARPLRPELVQWLGRDVSYADVVTHDTESALLAAPELDGEAVFVSLGTSVIFGTRTPQPLVSDDSYDGRFKNMQGAFGANSLCRDLTGLWLLEQCMAQWRIANPALTYGDVLSACQAAGPNNSYFDINDPGIRFYQGTLPQAITRYCLRTGQKPPKSIGEVALCVMESIVLEVLWSYRRIQELTGVAYRRISAVGGGVRNRLFLQMLADALELPLYVGSPYAATTGNILMQLYALGELSSREGVAEVARNTCCADSIQPHGNKDKWDAALYKRTERDGWNGQKN